MSQRFHETLGIIAITALLSLIGVAGAGCCPECQNCCEAKCGTTSSSSGSTSSGGGEVCASPTVNDVQKCVDNECKDAPADMKSTCIGGCCSMFQKKGEPENTQCVEACKAK